MAMHWNQIEKDGVAVITFPLFERAGLVHGFSTRKGGVSTGQYAAMNLGFKTGDKPESVMENHKRFAKAVGYDEQKLVFGDQVHGTEVRRVDVSDAGKGIFRESDIKEVDGLVTDDENVVLMTFCADCIPLFFYDPVRRAVGSSHSGWRGTVARMGARTVEAMEREFGSRPEDILAVVGPSICADCYEVGKEVADAFCQEFDGKWRGEILRRRGGEETVRENRDGEEKYQLDLWRANEIILLEAGLLAGHIEVSGLCTCCHKDLLFSHRATGGRRGSLAGAITLGKPVRDRAGA